ncbi:hypothetical protein N7519_008974 [Penicillium mononematosum]|uniref:uncharacterized protein n=1 Tax=Penicillium mononematosum TaxID=268346 RepID=UPI002549A400|nr:uncharacterized protein N7519_008974 [Penicillium mononematosum]KAJ6178513.1 hypothetical protein N7519_008974 [Penicillium mononematosum]
MIDVEYPFLVSSATSRISSTSSLAVSSKDASAKNDVVTGTYSSVAVSEGTKRVDEITKSRTWDGDLPGKMQTLSYGEFDLVDQPCCDNHFICTGYSSVHGPPNGAFVCLCSTIGRVHRQRKELKKKKDFTIYGIASNGYTFVLLKIDNDSKPSSHAESNKPQMSPQSRDTGIILLRDNVYGLASLLYGGATEAQTPLQHAGWRDAVDGLGDVLATLPHCIPPAVRPIALALHVECERRLAHFDVSLPLIILVL